MSSRAAARMRLLRQRARDRRLIVTVEIEPRQIDYLLDAELLELGQIEDRQAIAAAILDLFDLLIAAERLRRDA